MVKQALFNVYVIRCTIITSNYLMSRLFEKVTSLDLVWWEVVEKLGDLIVEQLLPGQSGPGNTVLKKRQAS